VYAKGIEYPQRYAAMKQILYRIYTDILSRCHTGGPYVKTPMPKHRGKTKAERKEYREPDTSKITTSGITKGPRRYMAPCRCILRRV